MVYVCSVGRVGLRKERKGRDDLYCLGGVGGVYDRNILCLD